MCDPIVTHGPYLSALEIWGFTSTDASLSADCPRFFIRSSLSFVFRVAFRPWIGAVVASCLVLLFGLPLYHVIAKV